MQLYLARHAESTYNVDQLLNSDPSVNVRLSETGIIQAEELAKKLDGENFESIYISELPRTKQTADIINKNSQIPLVIDKRINENIMGFEGQPVNIYYSSIGDGPDRMERKFNDGESLSEVQERVESFITDLKKSGYSKVLVITHGCIIECMYSIINNQEFNYGHGHIIPQGDFEIFEL
mgnify:FL=1